MERVIKFSNHANDSLEGEKNLQGVKYEIVSVVDSYQDTKEVYVTIQVKGTSKIFTKSVKELYDKKWLEEFSREDVAYIGFLYAAEESKKLPLVEYFPRKKKIITRSVVFIGMLFTCFVTLCNLTAFKLVTLNIPNLFSIDFPAALLFFPLTYFFDDTLTEVYGFKISRLIIWGGLFCNTLFILCAWFTVYLPSSPVWDLQTHGESAYKLIFTGSIRTFAASTIAYFCGEFLNSIILAKLKILTSGRLFFLRAIGSTGVGVGVDSIIFCNIAFYHILPVKMIWGIILTQYVFKLSYEFLMLPFTYLLINKLKKHDQVDYYDFKTKFNPFSLSLTD